jgi:hypothetical protein
MKTCCFDTNETKTGLIGKKQMCLYFFRKRGGRSGPDYRIAPGETSATTRAIQTAPSRVQDRTWKFFSQH